MTFSINTALKDFNVQCRDISDNLLRTEPQEAVDQLKKIKIQIDQILISNPNLEGKEIKDFDKLFSSIHKLESTANNNISARRYIGP
jgi:hypothetical protein